jgi:metallo-beta-lactamase family protein
MESTYGDRLHGTADPLVQLEKVINGAIYSHGSVLIPSFAVGRAQEIMHMISTLKNEKRIPDWLPVFLDSPMAASATDIFIRYPEWHNLTKEECERMCHDVVINTDYHNTQEIIKKHSPKIVISASGMLTGGRVLEYMKYMAPDPNNYILLIGYQAEGTRGRALQNHTHEVKIHGKFYPVNANITEITGLSGHADQGELLRWLQPFETDKKAKVFLVHGEPCAQDAFRVKVKSVMDADVKINVENEEMVLFSTVENELKS